MKTFGILLLLLPVFILEIVLTICTVSLYLFIVTDMDELLTAKLINKL